MFQYIFLCLIVSQLLSASKCPDNRAFYAKLAETSDFWKERLAYLDKLDNVNNCFKKQINMNNEQIIKLELYKEKLEENKRKLNF